ncbi:MAG: hypothetical protein VXW38_10340 [Bacteroidota bacterium]|nr:hypothetical protein [Bacteroidota bacterium]
MYSDLDALIDFYQWEKQRLLLSIEENKRDQDFLAVDYNYQELRNVQQELDCLLELKDPNYPKIKRLESEIAFYSKREGPYLGFSELHAPMLKKAEDELKKLKDQKSFPSSEETQVLDEALFSFAKNEIKGFTLYLDLEMNSRIDFVKLGDDQIELSLKVDNENDARNIKKYRLSDILDLTYEPNSKCLVKTFDIRPNTNILPIKETVSRIVIMSKGFFRSKNTIYLKRTPKK